MVKLIITLEFSEHSSCGASSELGFTFHIGAIELISMKSFGKLALPIELLKMWRAMQS